VGVLGVVSARRRPCRVTSGSSAARRRAGPTRSRPAPRCQKARPGRSPGRVLAERARRRPRTARERTRPPGSGSPSTERHQSGGRHQHTEILPYQLRGRGGDPGGRTLLPWDRGLPQLAALRREHDPALPDGGVLAGACGGRGAVGGGGVGDGMLPSDCPNRCRPWGAKLALLSFGNFMAAVAPGHEVAPDRWTECRCPRRCRRSCRRSASPALRFPTQTANAIFLV